MHQPNVGHVEFSVLLSDVSRLDVEIDYVRGKVTDISLQLLGYVDDRPVEMVRYDNAHGPFHRHIYSPSGTSEVYNFPISIHPNTIAARAQTDLRDNHQRYYDEYVRKYRNLRR